MKKLVLILWISGAPFLSEGQAWQKSMNGSNISVNDADSLLKKSREPNSEIIRIGLFLKLAEFNIFKDGDFKPDFDKAQNFIRRAKDLNIRVKSQECEGYQILLEAYCEKGLDHPKASKLLIERAIQTLKPTGDRFHLARAYAALAGTYDSANPLQSKLRNELLQYIFRLLDQVPVYEDRIFVLSELAGGYSNFDQIIIYLKQVALFYLHKKDKQTEFWARKEIANCKIQQGKFAVVQAELLVLLKEQKANHDPNTYATTDLLFLSYLMSKNYSQSLYYAFESINDPNSHREPEYLIILYSRFTNIYSSIDNTEEYIKWLKIMLDYASKTRQIHWIYESNRQLSGLLIKKGKVRESLNLTLALKRKYPPQSNEDKKILAACLGKCYAGLKNYPLAERYFKEVVRLYTLQIKLKETKHGHLFDYTIGFFYLDWKHYDQAALYFKKVINGDPAIINNTSYKDLFKGMFKIDSVSGNYLSAIRYLQIYQRLNDSAFNIARNEQIEKLQISFDTEQKKKDIKLLQDKEKIQQIELKHIENTRNWITVAAIMLMMLLGISYNRYLFKQRSNRLLQAQRDEINNINSNLKKLVIEKDGILEQKGRLLKEKEWLLKEVHHRVKNNLHTVICLLESQAVYLENDALKAIESSQHRIYVMSLIHQKLYQSDDIRTIDMSVYLPEFIQYLNESFGVGKKVRFQLDIEPIYLAVSQAIPLALIINEAVTNSIKYAFSESLMGVITVSMHLLNRQITVVISDNGKGMEPEIAEMPLESLGLKLMNGLTGDIDGRITFENKNGTRIVIVFSEDPMNDSSNLLTDKNQDET